MKITRRQALKFIGGGSVLLAGPKIIKAQLPCGLKELPTDSLNVKNLPITQFKDGRLCNVAELFDAVEFQECGETVFKRRMFAWVRQVDKIRYIFFLNTSPHLDSFWGEVELVQWQVRNKGYHPYTSGSIYETDYSKHDGSINCNSF